MDYKDIVTVSLALLCGLVGGGLAGGPGLLSGVVVGAGVGATWAYQSDLRAAVLADRAE